jgi:DNA polymerase-4
MSSRRKIIHVDMDAFFAAVEQRDNPELKGKPVIVGGPFQGRGVVSTASYEARKFGIHSAMPAATAKRLCPQGIFVRPHFEKYREASSIVMGILRQHTDLVESVSLDEAYLDVTHNRFQIADSTMIAKLIQQNIFAATHLTASAGVAPNMFLAKIASDFNKPSGLTVVTEEGAQDFLKPLDVRKIPGIGPVGEKKLNELGIKSCEDILRLDEGELALYFGKFGHALYRRARGLDDRQVEPHTERKQVSTERTYEKDVTDLNWLGDQLKLYAQEVFEILEAKSRTGKTVILKVKYANFEVVTRSQTNSIPPSSWEDIYETAWKLLTSKTEAGRRPIRLLGLGVSGLSEGEGVKKSAPTELFGSEEYGFSSSPKSRRIP